MSTRTIKSAQDRNSECALLCSLCGESFDDFESIKTHYVGMVTRASLLCVVCNKAFSRGDSPRSHIEKHHKNEVPCKLRPKKSDICKGLNSPSFDSKAGIKLVNQSENISPKIIFSGDNAEEFSEEADRTDCSQGGKNTAMKNKTARKPPKSSIVRKMIIDGQETTCITILKDETDGLETITVSKDDTDRQETITVSKDDTDRQETITVSKDDTDRQETITVSKDDTDRQETITVSKDDTDRQETITTSKDDTDGQETIFRDDSSESDSNHSEAEIAPNDELCEISPSDELREISPSDELHEIYIEVAVKEEPDIKSDPDKITSPFIMETGSHNMAVFHLVTDEDGNEVIKKMDFCLKENTDRTIDASVQTVNSNDVMESSEVIVYEKNSETETPKISKKVRSVRKAPRTEEEDNSDDEDSPRAKSGKISRVAESDKNFVCDECGKGYTRKSRLKAHQKNHSGKDLYDCPICDRKFIFRDYLKKHMRTHKNFLDSESDSVLVKTEKDASTDHSYTDSEQTTDGKNLAYSFNAKSKTYKCNKCEKGYTRKNRLLDHMKTHISKERHKCPVCMRSFTLREYMARHLKSHGDLSKYKIEKKYMCGSCDISFFEQKELQRHLKVHHGDRSFGCPLCSTLFLRKDNLKDHLLKHKNYTAKIPDEKIPNVDILTGNFKCRVCKMIIVDISDYRLHCATHDPMKKYSCSECDKIFSTRAKQQRHIRTHTPKTDVEKEYLCELCTKRFSEKDNLRKHMRIHKNHKPAICDVCGKGFYTECILKIHMRVHTGECPYTCKTCGKSYNQRGTLLIHMRQHSDSRPFKCESCTAAFRTKGQLNRHMLTHTGEKPYACEVCGRCFATRGMVKKHLQTHFKHGSVTLRQIDENSYEILNPLPDNVLLEELDWSSLLKDV